MAITTITIRDVRTIATAPDGINLLVVKIETSEPGLYGIGCSTFCYRYATVQHLIETYLKPLLIGRPVQGITDLWQLMHQNGYWRKVGSRGQGEDREETERACDGETTGRRDKNKVLLLTW